MHKEMSLRLKITLWFSLALTLVIVFSYIAISNVTKNVLVKNLQDNLVETVLHNIRGLDIVPAGEEEESADVLHYKEYLILIDEDFLDSVNGMRTALYDSDHNMLYGENPIAKQSFVIDFSNDIIKELNINKTKYYIYDIKLGEEQDNDLWMRGVVSEDEGLKYVVEIRNNSLYTLIPILVLSIVGGYLLLRYKLKPIEDVSNAAQRIQKSGDLKERVPFVKGYDEPAVLAKSFNSMLQRIDDAFYRQKQFTSDASHELRTPTTVILAQAEYYLEEERTKEEYVKALTVVERQANRMKDLINNMLDISRLEIKPQNYPKERTSLSEIVELTSLELSALKEKDITLSYVVEPNIYIKANHQLISRMLTNLINNAYRYGKENGRIMISLKDMGNTAELRVKDNGTGIKKEEIGKIFDRFYQSDNSRSGQGSGLGLSMVKEIVNFHDAKIKVNSELGVGSEFKVIFDKLQ